MKLLRSFSKYYSCKPVLDELIFFVTYRCNFKCKTCFFVNSMNAGIMNKIKELTIDEISKISSSLGSFSKLLISGGEPSLREDLPEVCEIFYRRNKINLIHLPMNGFYADKVPYHVERILNKCPHAKLVVSLPLDGFAATHDTIKGVPGSFEKVKDAISNLVPLKEKMNNLNLNIISVVNNMNMKEMVKLAEFIRSNPAVDNHSFSPVRGSPYDEGLLPPSGREWKALLEQLMPFYYYWNRKRMPGGIKARLAVNKIKYLNKVYTQVLDGGRLPFRCQAGNIIAVLEPDGSVRLCELSDIIGNVRDAGYDLKKVLFSDQAVVAREKIRHCACTHACFLSPSIMMDPRTLFKSHFVGN